jgi:SLOG in TRPM, prokaryote
VSPRQRTIDFPGGTSAHLLETPPDTGGDELLAALRLPPPKGTIVLNGSVAALELGLGERLAAVVGTDGLAGAVEREGLTAVTGATDAGIFSILGRAMAGGPAPLVGVAPRRLVTWPGRLPPALRWLDRGRVPLERHHSHFVLVDGHEWGDETPALLALARALHVLAPSVALVCGGGPVTRNEVLGHVRDGRPVVVVAGSGRFADELAAALNGQRADDDASVEEIVAHGRFTVCPLSDGASALVEAVHAALRPA